jgi:hypothetical protein
MLACDGSDVRSAMYRVAAPETHADPFQWYWAGGVCE